MPKQPVRLAIWAGRLEQAVLDSLNIFMAGSEQAVTWFMASLHGISSWHPSLHAK